MTDKQDCEGLVFLTWSQFDSPDQPGSGFKFMERDTVQILDRVIHKTKMVFKIEMGYASPKYARIKGLAHHDSHKIGKAVRIRVTNNKQRMRLVGALWDEGVRRFATDRETLYFDTDNIKGWMFTLWC